MPEPHPPVSGPETAGEQLSPVSPAIDGAPEIVLPGGAALDPAAQEQADQIALTVRLMVDGYVTEQAATWGAKVKAHVQPTIDAVVQSAGQTIAATRELRQAGDTAQAAVDHVAATAAAATEEITQTAAEARRTMDAGVERIDASLTTATERIVAADQVLVARTTEVEELIVRGAGRLEVIERATHDQIITALREMRTNGTPEEQRMARRLEMEAQLRHTHFPLLQACMEAGVPAWMHGEASSGKSTAPEQLAELFGTQFRSLVVNPTTSEAKLLGFIDAAGNYHTTGLRSVVDDGGIFLLDEADNGNPGSLTVINAILSNGAGEFPDGRVKCHPLSRFVVAANTVGKGATSQYVGRNRIDAATLDRFAFVPWDIDEGLEAAIIGLPNTSRQVDIAQGGVPDRAEWLATVRTARAAVGRLTIDQIISTRATSYGVRLAEQGVGRRWLTEMLLFKGMNKNNREKLGNALSGTA